MPVQNPHWEANDRATKRNHSGWVGKPVWIDRTREGIPVNNPGWEVNDQCSKRDDNNRWDEVSNASFSTFQGTKCVQVRPRNDSNVFKWGSQKSEKTIYSWGNQKSDK